MYRMRILLLIVAIIIVTSVTSVSARVVQNKHKDAAGSLTFMDSL